MKNSVIAKTLAILLAKNFFLAFATVLPSPPQTPTHKHSAVSISCHGISVTSLAAENGLATPKVDKSSDEMKVARHGQKLRVTVNGEIAKKLVGQPNAFTDIYTITAETQEGIAATQGDPHSPTVHTLVIDPTGTIALWTESTVWYLASISRPFTETVFFSCHQQ